MQLNDRLFFSWMGSTLFAMAFDPANSLTAYLQGGALALGILLILTLRKINELSTRKRL